MHTCCTAIQISFASLESKVANLRNFGIQICVSPQDSNPACGWKDSTCIENAFNTSDKRKKVLVCHEDLRCNMCASPSAKAGTQCDKSKNVSKWPWVPAFAGTNGGFGP